MAKRDRTKPHVNIGTIGHMDHGKTVLTAAITQIMADTYGGNAISYQDIAKGGTAGDETKTVSIAVVEYQTSKRHYAHVDCPSHADYVKGLITGAARMDGAILVVSAMDGPMSQTTEHVLLARQVGVPKIVVFLSKRDAVEDEDLIDMVETEVRKLLSVYGYDGDNAPVVRGSALFALRGLQAGADSVMELMEAVDHYIDAPVREVDAPFLMAVDDVFSIKGRGTAVTGRIERGRVRPGEEVEILGFVDTRATVVTGVEMFRSLVDEAIAGDNVGCLLRGIDKDEVERGQVLAAPGSVQCHTKFQALVYVLTKDEGGRQKPFRSNYRPQFYLRTTDVTGVITLPDGVKMVMPGDYLDMNVELITPVPLEEGQRFAIRDDGRTVGAGIITRVAGRRARAHAPEGAVGALFDAVTVGASALLGAAPLGSLGALPVIGLSHASTYAYEQLRDDRMYRDGYVRQWSDASNPRRPAVVFVPGFLTEIHPKEANPDAPANWRDPIVALARDRDFASYMLHWPSTRVMDMILSSPDMPELLLMLRGGGAAVAGAAVVGVEPAAAVAAMFGGALAYRVFRLWKAAVAHADRIGSAPSSWIKSLNRPVILVGHSLGGRIVLRAAENASAGEVLGALALAPAVAASELDLVRVRAGTAKGVTIMHSLNDNVLAYLFRGGQTTTEHALGYEGLPNMHGLGIRTKNVSVFRDREMGHNDYAELVYSMIANELSRLA